MKRFLLTALVAALLVLRCDCGSDDGDDNDPVGPGPVDIPAEIDSTLWGIWHLYNTSDVMIEGGFMRANEDSIIIADTMVYTGVPDADPQFARKVVAQQGQIYYVFECTGCPNQYFYDFVMFGDSLLYMLPDSSDVAQGITSSTPGVLILKRTSITDTTQLARIDTDLIGTWDRYDSTGTMVVMAGHMIVTADSIVRRYSGGSSITFKGISDPYGDRGQTLVAESGQVYYEYHIDQSTTYWFDYAFDGTTLYFVDETTDAATNPGSGTDNVVILKPR